VVYLFDVSRQGKQFPELALLVKANKKLECPAGRIDFYDRDTMLVGGGDLKDLAPKEKCCVSIAISRKIQAHVTETHEDLPGAVEGTILRKFTVKVMLTNTTPHKLTLGYSLPRNQRLLSDIYPKPNADKERALLWFREVDEKEEFVLVYTETIDRQ